MKFLITCATGNIGSALCFYLAKKKHDLIITGRNLEKLRDLSVSITTDYPERKVTFCCADLGDPETMTELIKHSGVEGIDGIVLMPPRPPLLPTELIPQFHALNKAMKDCFTGPRYLLQELLPSLKDSDLKSVILVSGTSSKQPIVSADFEAFNDIRTAWVGCFKTFADIYGSMGIRFNTISPGQIVTPTYIKKIEAEAEARAALFTEVLRERTTAAPLGKLPSIRGVIKTIYFFLKSSGAGEITGDNIAIDGGTSRTYY